MRDVRDGLRKQLSDADAAHQAADESCANDLAVAAAGMTGEQANMAKLAGMSEFDKATLQSRKEERQSKMTELGDRQAMAESMANQRAAEEERWHAIQEEHRMVQGMIEDVRGIVASRLMHSEGEFLETKTNMFMSLSAKLKEFKPKNEKGLSHGYGAMFTLLAQLLEKNPNAHGDQVVVQTIMGLIDRVEENLGASLALEREAERERAADYVEISGRIQGYILQCNQRIVGLAGEINLLEDRVRMANNKMQVAQENAAMWNDRLMDRKAECDVSQSVWENFFNNIQAELATMGKIMYLLEDKRALLARYGL